MRAAIGSYASGYHAAWYNERKVREGVAERLFAGNFLEDTEQLMLETIVWRFSALEELNQRSESKVFHISLIFAPDEQFSNEKFVKIAREYLELMGLGRQPYLIYRHMDAGSPHLHLVASRVIPPDGSRVLYPKAPHLVSAAAVKQLVEKHGLVKAWRVKPAEMSPGAEPRRVVYGKSPSTKTVEEVLAFVLPRYKYTDLNELNAVLLQYNVFADAGGPGSVIARNRGLAYQIQDENGAFAGGRVPASRLPSKPGVAWLEKAFEMNKLAREPELALLRTRITLAAMGARDGWGSFSNRLLKEGIVVTPVMDNKGMVRELAYVDHRRSMAVMGLNLGREFSSSSIFGKLGVSPQLAVSELKHRRKAAIGDDLRLLPDNRNRALQYLGQHGPVEGPALKTKLSL